MPGERHPRYIDMIIRALSALRSRRGTSREALERYIKTNYDVGAAFETHFRMALRKGLMDGTLAYHKGVRSIGRFELVVTNLTVGKQRKSQATQDAKSTAMTRPRKVIISNRRQARRLVSRRTTEVPKSFSKARLKKHAVKK